MPGVAKKIDPTKLSGTSSTHQHYDHHQPASKNSLYMFMNIINCESNKNDNNNNNKGVKKEYKLSVDLLGHALKLILCSRKIQKYL